ncbi:MULTISPECIES: hypothetical protein [Trueperella]|uniref:Terminase n=1 Tax=Trueperella abortisuis TaxID=445930 RepID=A0ABT9PJW8_9ACTO|nr:MULTISPECIES: hypothetical protein [Trueperella]MCI7306163.1 phage terminase family protein [Trueperella sp.]MDP9833007.1 hypothetical protein [Trueperella abortisuis]
MAVLRGGHGGLIRNRDMELREIKDWYREHVPGAPRPEWLHEPVIVGPTWKFDENGWVLPEFTGGWDVLAWCGLWLNNPDGEPWRFTMEQARFTLWFFATEPGLGTFVHPSAVLQRLKGWGKDPYAAALEAAHFLGPSVSDGVGDDGQPIMVANPAAWVQNFAVSQEQTKNTMSLFPGLFGPQARKHFGIQVGRNNVWALGDSVRIEAVTASHLAAEGNRVTFAVRNETQNWNSSNQGHELAGVIDGNVTKARGDRPARVLDICNAYREGEDSVGQRVREGWEETQDQWQGGELVEARREDFGLLYDSLEAAPSAELNGEGVDEWIPIIRGDSVWIDPERVKKSVFNPTNAPSESRRKWLNQIQAEADAWTTAQIFDSLADAEVVVEAGEEIVLFFDASKSDDATGLVGCRVVDGHVFVLGMWQRPAGKLGQGWRVPREDVDRVVEEAHDRYRVVAFFADPAHVFEDESQLPYWDGVVDGWHRRWGAQYAVDARPGRDRHSVMFDMATSAALKPFVQHVSVTEQEMIDGAFTHDADARLRRHVLAAKRYPTRYGMSIAKEHPESRRKIDLAVCMVGARLVRRLVLNSRKTRRRGAGRIW